MLEAFCQCRAAVHTRQPPLPHGVARPRDLLADDIELAAVPDTQALPLTNPSATQPQAHRAVEKHALGRLDADTDEEVRVDEG